MNSLKLTGSNEANRSTATDVNDYLTDARDRLRRLANRTSAPAVPPTPTPAANDTRPEPAKASPGGLDHLRAAVVDRAVDRLVDRLLQQWERGGQPENRLDEHIIDRLVERLVSKLENT